MNDPQSNLVSIVLRVPQAMRLVELIDHPFLKLYLTERELEITKIIDSQLKDQLKNAQYIMDEPASDDEPPGSNDGNRSSDH